MAVLAAGGAEAYTVGGNFSDATNPTVDMLSPVSPSTTSIYTHDTTWAGKNQDYAIAATINANGEHGDVFITEAVPQSTRGGYQANQAAYVSFRFSFTSDILAPSAAVKLLVIAGGWFSGYILRINSGGGNWQLTDASAVVKATWSSPGLTAGQTYAALLQFDSVGDTINLWVGAESSVKGLLASASSWTGSPVLTYTDAAQTGNFGQVTVGLQNFPKSNANASADSYIDDIVYYDSKPAQPHLCWLSELSGDGNYSGGSTVWTKDGGGAATYTRINDSPASPADDTSYITHPTGGAGTVDRYSATHESCATMGLISGDQIRAVMPLCRVEKVSGSTGTTTWQQMFMRYNGTDQDPSADYFGVAGAIWRPAWTLYSQAPGSVAWTQDVFDNTEWGVKYVENATFLALWRISWGGVYVVTERAPAVGKIVEVNQSVNRAAVI